MQRTTALTGLGCLFVLSLSACAGAAQTPAAASPGAPSSTAPLAPQPSYAAVTVAPSAAANPAQQALAGYLAIASNGVVFVQWTNANGALTGTLTQSYTAPSDPTTLLHESASFSGVLSNGSVTLTFPQGLGLATTWSGSLNGGTLILSYAATNGELNTLTFQQATVADFNQALAQEQATVGQAKAAQQAAASAAAVQQQLDDAVNAAAHNLYGALNQLTNDVVSASSDAAQMSQDAASANGALSSVSDALGKVQQAAAVSPMDSYQQSEVCYEVSGVSYEVSGVTYYTDPVRQDGQQEAQSAASVTTDASAAQSAADALQSAISADPAGPGVNVTPAQVPSIIAGQEEKLATANAQAADALKSAAASDAGAAKLYSQAQQVAASVGAQC